MKSASLFLLLVFILASLSGSAQYYYKDIVLTRQTQETRKTYSENKVKKVTILSTEKTGEPTPGFACTQLIAPDYHSIETFTKSADVAPSVLQAFYDSRGRLIKTVDTSDAYKSTSVYRYDEQGGLSAIVNTGLETDNQINAVETHNWFYQDGRPVKMIKVKNGTDSTLVEFKSDDKGNVTEERAVRGKEHLPAVYYYYDNEQRLTDIVRYNEKAGRLLPDYVFEYDQQRMTSMLVVPAGSNDYQKWVYEYNSNGLKARETCLSKRKETIAQISYQYSFQ